MVRHKQAHPRRNKGRLHTLMKNELVRSNNIRPIQADTLAAEYLHILRALIGEAIHSAELHGRPNCITPKDVGIATRLHGPLHRSGQHLPH